MENEPVITEQDVREETEPNGRASSRTGIPRGRKKGGHNSSRTRYATKLRVQAFRAREQEKIQLDNEHRERTENTVTELRQRGYSKFGETEALGENGYPTDAATPAEELAVAMKFAKALGLAPPRKGQQIRNFVEETLRAHCLAGSRMLNLETLEFAPNEFTGGTTDPSGYTWIDGMNEPIPDGITALGPDTDETDSEVDDDWHEPETDATNEDDNATTDDERE